MNWLDFNFWFFGPTSIWFLGAVILFAAIMWLRTSNKIRTELGKGVTQLEKITTELRDDTSQLRDATTSLHKELAQNHTSELKDATTELNQELRLTRTSIDNWYKSLQQSISYWFPFFRGGNNK